MTSTTYASFIDYEDAEKAIGAVMDHGVPSTDISMIANERYNTRLTEYGDVVRTSAVPADTEQDGKTGLSTTTAGDAGIGAVKGASIGLAVGILAAAAAVFLPGIGFIIGGAAMTTALAGTAGAVGGGVIAGGVYGYLKDQGVPEDLATSYRDTVSGGGVLVAVTVEENVDKREIEQVLSKYNALNVNRYGAATVL